ncbi:MAG: DUF1223 domain-containing protein [Hyphomicrobiaceae bacterium]|nr:DUF1223 domain-containing protein [Hyphomicrobiaceae bacterium]
MQLFSLYGIRTRPAAASSHLTITSISLRTIFASLALLATSLAPTTAIAADPAPSGAENVSRIVNVIELYTSQGCSSCPPADALLKTYAARKDILAISLPVDYWDYLGWKDTLGSAKHSERQRNYARARGDGQVYTPQVVINGLAHAVGSSRSAIDAALMLTRDELAASRVPLKFWTEGGSLVIEAGAAAPNSSFKDGVVWLAVIQPSAEVEIERGENRGRKVAYTNVVREMTPVGTWTGQPMRIQLARTAVMRKELERVAVLIQSGKAGPIIGAAVTGLW